jgi:hypothetical protein
VGEDRLAGVIEQPSCEPGIVSITKMLFRTRNPLQTQKSPALCDFFCLTVRSGVIVVWNADLYLLPAAYQSSAISTRNDYLTCLN